MSINQATAAAEKMAAILTAEYLEGRAARASRARFKAVLAKVPGGPPVKGDELPGGSASVRGRARRRGR